MGLHVAGLSKRYGRVTALDRVSFSLRNGEVLGLIGPNGAGKTTLFECLAGLLPSDAGSISIDNAVVAASERNHHLFYLPDAIAPWPAQPVRWALDFTRDFFGASGTRIEDVIARLDLAAMLDARIGTLSKGQRKRVLLAIGLLTPQRILLVDEPFDGLDLRQGRDVAATLREHAANGRTLFLSIHQIHDAARMCDRFILLSLGRIRGEGTLDELTALASRPGAPRVSDLADVFLALT